MANPKLTITSDVSQLERDYQRILRENVKQREALHRLGKAGEEVGRGLGMSMRQLRQFAQQTIRAVQTPAQQYRAELERLRAAKRADMLTEQQYQQAKERTKQRIREQSEAYRQQRAEQERLRRVAQQAVSEMQTGVERQRARLNDLRAAWQAGHMTVEQYRQAVQRVHAESEQMVASAGPGLQMIQARLAGIISGTVGLGAIVADIRRALDDAKQLRDEVHGRQLTAAQAQADAVLMLGDVGREEAGRFVSRVEGVARDAEMQDTAQLFQAAASTLSAVKGDQDLTLSILRQAVPLLRHRPEQLPEFAGAVADLATLQGVREEEDITRVIATVLSTQGQARIQSLGAFKEAAAGIAGAAAVDTSGDADRAIREAGAAFAAIGGAIKDPSGAMTKTAVAQLAVQLEALLPEETRLRHVSDEERARLEQRREQLQSTLERQAAGGLDPRQAADLRRARADLVILDQQRDAERDQQRREQLDARAEQMRERIRGIEETAEPATPAQQRATAAALREVQQSLQGIVQEGTGLSTLAERIAAVQGDQALQRQFAERATFRGAVAPVIQRMLTDPTSEAAREFQTALPRISDDPEYYRTVVEAVREASPQLGLATTEAGLGAAFERHAQEDPQRARAAQAEETVREVLRRTRGRVAPLQWTRDRMAMGAMGAMIEGDDVPEQRAVGMLLRRRAEMLQHLDPQTYAAGPHGGMVRATPFQPGESLEEMIERSSRELGTEADVAVTRRERLSQREQANIELIDQTVRQLIASMERTAEASEATRRASEDTRDTLVNRPVVGNTAATDAALGAQTEGR